MWCSKSSGPTWWGETYRVFLVKLFESEIPDVREFARVFARSRAFQICSSYLRRRRRKKTQWRNLASLLPYESERARERERKGEQESERAREGSLMFPFNIHPFVNTAV